MESIHVLNDLMWKVWVTWEHSSDLVSKSIETKFTKAGISYQQFVILTVMLSMNNSITATNLAKRLERKVNTMSTILDRMEKKGLVKKLRDIPDNRIVRIVVTQMGMETVQQGTKLGWNLIEKLTSSFSEEELQVFSNLLDKFRRNAFKEIYNGEDVQDIRTEDYHNIAQALEKSNREVYD